MDVEDLGGGREGTRYLANWVDGLVILPIYPFTMVVDEMGCCWEGGRKIDISHLSHGLTRASEYLNSVPERFWGLSTPGNGDQRMFHLVEYAEQKSEQWNV